MAPSIEDPLPRTERRKNKHDAFLKAWYDKSGVLENFKGAKPYVNELTTLGKRELINSYDHFVFTKDGDLKNCDTNGAGAFDFTNREHFVEADEIIRNHDLQNYKDEIRQEKKFKGNKMVDRYSSKKQEYLAIGYQNKILSSYENETFEVYKELISDHLPIYMNCKIKN